MAGNLERRIEALEARRVARRLRVAVIHQNEDGAWPGEPDAKLVVGMRRMGIMEPDDLSDPDLPALGGGVLASGVRWRRGNAAGWEES